MVKWYHVSFPRKSCDFDYRYPLSGIWIIINDMGMEIDRCIRFDVSKDKGAIRSVVHVYNTSVVKKDIEEQAKAIEEAVKKLEKAGEKPSQSFLNKTAFHDPRGCTNHDH